MKVLHLLLALTLTADGGVSPDYLRLVVLAQARCMDSDGGQAPVRVEDCVVTCVGEDAEARLIDGGVCLPYRSIQPVRVGDFWAPGEWPYELPRSK